MANLLLIDDDPDLLPEQVAHVFPAPRHRVQVAHTGTDGLKHVADAPPDAILLDLRLPDQSGLDVLRQLRQIDARIPVVVVTVVRSADSAIEAMRQGAYDYLLKPLDLQKLDRVIGEALKVARLMREPAVVVGTPPDDDQPGEAIVGSCPAMQEVYKAIGRVASETVRTDVRLIAATHRDLKAWSNEGKFRPDLYYRLGVFAIHLPPLRERGDDLALLVQFYLRRVSRELGREVREIAPEALERLRGYSWPGNVRELQSVLKQALLRAHGPVLLPDFLPELSAAPGEPAAPVAPPGGCFDPEALIRQRLGPDSRDLYEETHRELNRLLLPRVLAYT